MSYGGGPMQTSVGLSRDSTPLLQHSYMSPYKRPMWYRRKKFYLNLVRRTMAEFLATGLFVFVAVSSVGNVIWSNERAASATVVGLTHGMAYAALVAATMHVRYVCILGFFAFAYVLLESVFLPHVPLTQVI